MTVAAFAHSRQILFHCLREPEGYWWDRVVNWEGWESESGERKGMVEIVQARDIQWIGHDKRPVNHVSKRTSRGINADVLQYAHKADIIRLEV